MYFWPIVILATMPGRLAFLTVSLSLLLNIFTLYYINLAILAISANQSAYVLGLIV
jgi:hypothetical protein